MSGPNELAMMVEHYAVRILALLEVLVQREKEGLRIRPATVPLKAMDKAQWEQGKRVILDRLDVAEHGLSKEEIRQHLRAKGYERFAQNIGKAQKRRKCPLTELVEAGAIVAARDHIRKPARFYSRLMYLKHHISLPDTDQQLRVNKAIQQKGTDHE